jgi:hypothetical protein
MDFLKLMFNDVVTEWSNSYKGEVSNMNSWSFLLNDSFQIES